ncbi:MAG: tetratricopeptide repeat protein [Luteibaculaceae bacterium]
MNKLFLTLILLSFCLLKVFSQTKPAKFPGGENAFYKHCAKHFDFTQEILKNHYVAEVPISFIINKDGKLDSIVYNAALPYALEVQLNNVFEKLPRYKPASKQKTKVSSQINFLLSVNLPTAEKSVFNTKYKFEKLPGVSVMVTLRPIEFYTEKGLESAGILVQMAKISIQEEDYFTAQDYLMDALKYNPNSELALTLLAEVSFNLGIIPTACDCWKKQLNQGKINFLEIYNENCLEIQASSN